MDAGATFAGLPLAARATFSECHAVSPTCPVSATTLGYYPNVGVNAFLAAAFGLCAVVTLAVGAWKRTWSFSLAVGAGCLLECIGYAERVPLHANPWNQSAFEAQICAIILSPTLVCVGIYLTLKHVCFSLNPALSRIPPRVYPLLFVPADVSCLVVQAIGGGVAASAHEDNLPLLRSGNRLIIAGIVLQVVVLGAFGMLGADYLRRVRGWLRRGEGEGVERVSKLWNERRFKMFVWGMAGAYVLILIRCIYRIAEMAGGWGSTIMQDEPSFIVLESFMVLIACCLLTGFAPGIFFPQMSRRYREEQEKAAETPVQGQLSDAEAGNDPGAKEARI